MDNRQKYLRQNYVVRMNRVIDYIEANLGQELSLEELADIANFSPFHFHRIFTAMVGETLNSFIQRLRIERAASMLVQNPGKSITEIAFECGFSGSPVFARSFREAFHMSASDWRNGGHLEFSKDGNTDSKQSKPVDNNRQDFDIRPYYSNGIQIWRIEMKSDNKLTANVEVKEVPEMHIAYIRYIGYYSQNMKLFGNLFNRLFAWAGPRGLINFPQTKVMTIYHDNPSPSWQGAVPPP